MIQRRRILPARSRGVALVAVLYFLVLAALTSIAVVFGTRAALRRSADTRSDASLIAAAEAAVHGALSAWNGPEHDRQPVGSTVEYPLTPANGIGGTLRITRLGLRIFSLVADVHPVAGSPARRIALLVHVPSVDAQRAPPLMSAVDVTIGEGVHVATDTGTCGDSAAALAVAPGVNVSFDPAIAIDQQPTVRVDSSAADSSAYLAPGGWSWTDLVESADVRLSPDAAANPAPVVEAGACRADPANWGEPRDSTSPCRDRAPVVYAPGDLTIGGGVGQGVLLVDGRLTITGPFIYSGQIVVRRGMETNADAISISGSIRAWRAASESTHTHASRSDVTLAHGASLRGSRCDAAHGMTSLLQPRVVRAHGWTELF